MKKLAQIFSILCIFSLLYGLPAFAADSVPAAAKARFKAGVSLIEKAEKPDDLMAAMDEFEAAEALAPQWPDIHYNMAKLATETDKPARAIKEYKTYLELVPAAADRDGVEGQIEKLKEQIVRERKIGIPGVKFAALPDGIAVLDVLPGARVAKTGLKRGDKIISVDPPKVTSTGTSISIRYEPAKEKSADVDNLEDFFKAVERVSAGMAPMTKTQGRMSQMAFARSKLIVRASTERMFSRFSGNDIRESGPVIVLTVIRGGEKIPILIKKSMLQSKVIEIEGEEFDTEVLKESLPVVVTFWASSCSNCRELIPIIESDSTKYTGKIKFVNVNVDENKQLARRLGVNEVPTVMVFRGGSAGPVVTGALDKDKVAEILNNAAK